MSADAFHTLQRARGLRGVMQQPHDRCWLGHLNKYTRHVSVFGEANETCLVVKEVVWEIESGSEEGE